MRQDSSSSVFGVRPHDEQRHQVPNSVALHERSTGAPWTAVIGRPRWNQVHLRHVPLGDREEARDAGF